MLGGLAVLAALAAAPPVRAQDAFEFELTFRPVPVGAQALAVADLTGDGELDLAVVVPATARVFVFEGDGAGAFRFRARLAVPPLPLDVVAGDLENDGDVDLVLRHGTQSGFSVVAGLGGGAFAKPAHYASPAPVRGLLLAELDSRPGLDLAVGSSGSVFVHFGTQPAAPLPPGRTSGVPKLAAAEPAPGTGLFDPGVLALDDVAFASLTRADLNGDGNEDLAVGQNFEFGLHVLLGDGRGGFAHVFESGSWTAAPSHVQFADFDGDGVLDALGSTTDYEVALESQLGNGDGSFELLESLDYGEPEGWLRLADFDGDGREDAVFVPDPSSFDLGFIDDVGTASFFQPKQYLSLPDHDVTDGEVADFDSDGKPDLVVALPDVGLLAILLNRTPVPPAD